MLWYRYEPLYCWKQKSFLKKVNIKTCFTIYLQVRYPVLLTPENIKNIMQWLETGASTTGVSFNSVSTLTSTEAISTLKALDSKQFFPHGYFVVSWSPLRATPENYELAVNEIKPIVFVTKSEQGKVTALSFLCFLQNSLGYSMNLDFYGQVSGNIQSHIAKAIQYTFNYMMSKNADFHFAIFLGKHKESEKQEIMDFLHNKLSLSYYKGINHGNQIVGRQTLEGVQSRV